MRKRLIGVVVLGTATVFPGAVPAHADDASATTTIVSAPATAVKYVEWSSTDVVAEATAAKYVEWSSSDVVAPAMTVSGYVEW